MSTFSSVQIAVSRNTGAIASWMTWVTSVGVVKAGMRYSSKVSFAGVGYEEAMGRAREIVPVLASRAQKCEEARVLLPENEKLLHETGLFRYHQPKRFGGM